jgi:hypothetical protein
MDVDDMRQEVKRYALSGDRMFPHSEGRWVHAAEYDALRAELVASEQKRVNEYIAGELLRAERNALRELLDRVDDCDAIGIKYDEVSVEAAREAEAIYDEIHAALAERKP